MIYETEQGAGSAELASYYLQNGKGTHAYRYFGVHRLVDRPGWCYVFRVAAPGADAVSLVGEWDGWEPAPMKSTGNAGVWECVVSAAICPEGLRYKYRVQTGQSMHDKADPYARKSEGGGEGASVICTESHYAWQDQGYLQGRAYLQKEHERCAYPMQIYEVSLARWLDEQDTGYRKLGDLLSQYAADMGYTHVLLRRPCHQAAGKHGIVTYFVPDCTLGDPDDFAYFVDRLHKQGVGVLLELCCGAAGAHASGLCDFDGRGLYAKKAEQPARLSLDDPYATALLYSSALFWLRQYHVDGLYIDTQDLRPDRHTGELLRTLAAAVRKGMPDALLVLRADGYRGLSVGQALGGLGYDLVLDSRAEQALLDCFAASPAVRTGRRAWLDAARYLYAEDGILALSSALDAKQAGCLMESLFGEVPEKFAAMRLMLLYMTCLPAKKLICMGCEIGQFSPAFREGMAWFLQDMESHKALRDYVRALNGLYLQTAALWELDSSRDGMAAVVCENAPDCTVAFKRFDRAGREVCAVLHFGDRGADGVRVALGGRYPYYECIFSTDPMPKAMRLQTDGQGMITTDLGPCSGMLLAPLQPAGGFWFEND